MSQESDQKNEIVYRHGIEITFSKEITPAEIRKYLYIIDSFAKRLEIRRFSIKISDVINNLIIVNKREEVENIKEKSYFDEIKGEYYPPSNSIAIYTEYLKDDNDFLYTLTHEFGHALHLNHLDKEAYLKFFKEEESNTSRTKEFIDTIGNDIVSIKKEIYRIHEDITFEKETYKTIEKIINSFSIKSIFYVLEKEKNTINNSDIDKICRLKPHPDFSDLYDVNYDVIENSDSIKTFFSFLNKKLSLAHLNYSNFLSHINDFISSKSFKFIKASYEYYVHDNIIYKNEPKLIQAIENVGDFYYIDKDSFFNYGQGLGSGSISFFNRIKEFFYDDNVKDLEPYDFMFVFSMLSRNKNFIYNTTKNQVNEKLKLEITKLKELISKKLPVNLKKKFYKFIEEHLSKIDFNPNHPSINSFESYILEGYISAIDKIMPNEYSTVSYKEAFAEIFTFWLLSPEKLEKWSYNFIQQAFTKARGVDNVEIVKAGKEYKIVRDYIKLLIN